jgi:hypothetical protein
VEISPPIAALQADPAEQVRAQHGLTAALASWRENARVRRVLAGFSRYAKGAPLADQRELVGLFGGEEDAARDLVAPLLSGFARALAEQPLGVVPVRHFTDGVMSVLMLAREGDSLLTLTAIDGAGLAARPEPRSACFSPSDEWEVVLSGTGKARLVERCGDRIATHGLDLAPGLSLGRDGAREALIFDAADGVVLLLRLQRRLDASQARLEVSLDDGRVLHRASATPRESRHEMAVALLGKMGRSDAASVLAEIARDVSHGDSLRWQALRECLGLETRTGFWTLTAIARSGEDGLAIPAGALRAQLLEAHPQLAEVERCPA